MVVGYLNDKIAKKLYAAVNNVKELEGQDIQSISTAGKRNINLLLIYSF